MWPDTAGSNDHRVVRSRESDQTAEAIVSGSSIAVRPAGIRKGRGIDRIAATGAGIGRTVGIGEGIGRTVEIEAGIGPTVGIGVGTGWLIKSGKQIVLRNEIDTREARRGRLKKKETKISVQSG